MFLLYTAVCCIPFVFVLGGRVVHGILGRNVSFSWTLNNINSDAIIIIHDSLPLIRIWPLSNSVVLHKQYERLSVYVDIGTYKAVTVTVSISDIQENDAGVYKLERQWDSEDFNNSVILQILDPENLPWITVVRHDRLDSSIELQCKSSRIPRGKFIWKVNGSLIESHVRYSRNNSRLSIKNLTVDDKYNLYTCTAFGSEVESDPYSPNIYGPDAIYMNISDSIIYLDALGIVYLFCSADCFPPCQIGWIETNTNTPMPGSILKLEGVQNDVNCTCHATNPMNDNASISSTIYIKVISGTTYNTTTSIMPVKHTEGFPSKRLYLYTVIGLGVIIAVTFLVCLLRKVLIRLRAKYPVNPVPVNMVFLSQHQSTGMSNVYSGFP